MSSKLVLRSSTPLSEQEIADAAEIRAMFEHTSPRTVASDQRRLRNDAEDTHFKLSNPSRFPRHADPNS